VTDQKPLTGEAAEFAVILTIKNIPDDAGFPSPLLGG